MNLKTNIKYFYTVILAAVSFVTASEVALAQTVPVAKIAIIDNRIIGTNAAVAKDINRQVLQIRADMQAELQTQGNALRAEEESLKSQSAIMPQEAYNVKIQEFQQKAAEYQRSVQIKSQQLEIALTNANAEVQRVLKPILQKILQETGATLLIEKAFIIEQAPGLDVTTRVVEELDLALPSITLVLPEVPAAAPAVTPAN